MHAFITTLSLYTFIIKVKKNNWTHKDAAWVDVKKKKTAAENNVLPSINVTTVYVE